MGAQPGSKGSVSSCWKWHSTWESDLAAPYPSTAAHVIYDNIRLQCYLAQPAAAQTPRTSPVDDPMAGAHHQERLPCVTEAPN